MTQVDPLVAQCRARVSTVLNGKWTLEALLGYPRNEDYLSDPYYLGSTVGRYAGRIRDGAGHRPRDG